MDEMPGHTEERHVPSWMWVTINGGRWWRPSCMRERDTWRRCRQQVDDMWERMKADWKDENEEEGGWFS